MTVYVTTSDAMTIMALNGWHARDLGALDAVLARPKAAMFGVELYPGLHAKAAAMLDSTNRNHPLVDGNKRLSWLLVTLFYTLNDEELWADVDEAEEFVLAIAGSHLPIEEIATWLSARLVADEDTKFWMRQPGLIAELREKPGD